MKFALSTNWCNRHMTRGDEIADCARALGFDELELGFHTTIDQVDGFRARLSTMPVASIHAFCPVPLSAPHGYPELYSLATKDEDARALARFHIAKNIAFAHEMGAQTVVLHAGRVAFNSFFSRKRTSAFLREKLADANREISNPIFAKILAKAQKIREKRGAQILAIFRDELARLVPTLEKNGVTLALENLPYLEGFPNEDEMRTLAKNFAGAPIRMWFDTGHHRVREKHGWLSAATDAENFATENLAIFAGMHLNDVNDFADDHFAPGKGNIDFAKLKPLARAVRHRVFEPNENVSEEDLAKSLAMIRELWKDE